MKIHFSLLIIFIHLCLPSISAQVAETMQPPKVVQAKMLVNNKKLPAQNLTAPVMIDPKMVVAQKKWDVTLSQHGVSHASEVPKTFMDSIKHEGSLLRKNPELLLQNVPEQETLVKTGLTVAPQIGKSFKGNMYDNWAPPDNSMAVSDDGYVVSVINSSLFFSDVNGNILLDEGFDDFLSFLNLTGGYFDPRVIYDPVHDKFILVVLNGNTPATSTIVIGFSSASNPNETWWFYTFSGDPTGAGLWFDYPSIGISTDDLYISGNQFTPNNNFSQALIYQLEKAPGFTGGFVNGIHWYGVQDANGVNDFTVVPISHGFNTSIGPGIYFVSTNSTGGSEAMMYYTDNNSKNNPNLYVYSADIPNYYTPFDGLMKGTTDQLKTNDCKTQSGFYANGTIHFVFSNRGDDFHTKINYCRLNTNDLTQQTLVIGQTPYEYAFPSVAPFTASATDKTVLIGFLRTSGSIYPEFRMAVVDNDLNYSGSFLVKEGESFTNFDAGTKERWGDYTGISRRHSATGPEVWISGCYGEDSDNGASNILSTWIAQVTDGGQGGAAPVANFSANQTTVTAGQSVTFSDQSTNTPTSWTWSFPGGTPATSSVKNPVVTYNTPGTYSVTLVAANNAGNDSETKTNYITVNPAAQPPVANFSANQTTVTAGQSVTFSDQSTNTPTSWTWSFPGGTPATSSLKNPVVTYNTPGTYSVTLVAANNAGNDSETKTNYITVNPAAQPPVANFNANQTTLTAGQSVTFSDLSTNTPTSWTWSFPGGTPATSSVKNPVVTYNMPGTYSVTLMAANNAGNDSETKTNYITVNPAAQPPVADFTSDVTSISPGGVVQFEDLSINTPTSWQWSFPGGLPNTSNLQNPIVVYPSTGCFDVTLIATNAAGNHAVTKYCYVNVLTTGVTEKNDPFSRFIIFPNPVSSGERLNVEFEIEQPAALKFSVLDNRGAVVRELLHRQAKAGLNNLAFNTEPLVAGIYYLVVQDERGALLKNARFIVGK